MAQKMNPVTTGGRAGLGNVVAGEQTTPRESSACESLSQVGDWLPLGRLVLPALLHQLDMPTPPVGLEGTP
jgi:hypothetical protein